MRSLQALSAGEVIEAVEALSSADDGIGYLKAPGYLKVAGGWQNSSGLRCMVSWVSPSSQSMMWTLPCRHLHTWRRCIVRFLQRCEASPWYRAATEQPGACCQGGCCDRRGRSSSGTVSLR
ncbi:unnamed protein product [Symbiodinium sp. CCMP2592]|nr:unnamed protein product [Symbiodinium sp. CCMP2592]